MFKFSTKLDSQKKIYAGYQMGTVIGVGAFGEVRSAIDSRGQNVAIKIVDVTRFADKKTTDEIKRRIQREVDVLQGTSNNHIIELLNVHHGVSYMGKFCINCGCTQYDSTELDMYGNASGPCKSCGPHDGMQHSVTCTRNVTFMVQELAAGGELFSILTVTGPFSVKLAQYYFRQLISGVEYLHSMGIIHRDLKPENIVFSGDRFDLKIVDFGLATTVDISGDVNGLFHSGVGSTPYTAPEIFYQKELFQDRGYKGQPADIWSMAVILYIMLTGKPPFRRPLARNIVLHPTDARTPLIRPPNNFRRDKHFIKLMQGVYPEQVPQNAQSLLSQIFVQRPEDRLTMDEIKKHTFVHDLDITSVYREIEIPMYTRARKTFGYHNNHDSVTLLDRLHSNATLSTSTPYATAATISSGHSVNVSSNEATIISEFTELTLDNRHSNSSNGSTHSNHSNNVAGSRRSSRPSSVRSPNKPIVGSSGSSSHPGSGTSSRRVSPLNTSQFLAGRDSMSMPSPNYMDDGIMQLQESRNNSSHVVLSSSLASAQLENAELFREFDSRHRTHNNSSRQRRSGSSNGSHDVSSSVSPSGRRSLERSSVSSAKRGSSDLSGFVASSSSSSFIPRRSAVTPPRIPSVSGLTSSLLEQRQIGTVTTSTDTATINENSSLDESDLIEIIYQQPDETDLNLQHELDSSDFMNEQNSEFYQEVVANGPMTLLLKHIETVCSMHKNLWFKVHPCMNGSKMVEIGWRDDVSKKHKQTFEYISVVQLRCTVTFRRVSGSFSATDEVGSGGDEKWVMAIRRHEGKYDHFVKVAEAIRRRAAPFAMR